MLYSLYICLLVLKNTHALFFHSFLFEIYLVKQNQ